MTIEYAPLKFRPADKNLNIVLNDLREKLNEIIDSLNGASVTDKYVMVGANGAADYLSSLYFSRTIAGHIVIKNSYTTTTPLAGGGDMSAARTLSITGLSTIGTANYVPGVNAAGNAWEYKQLAAGTGISIVHAANLITISAGLATTHNVLSTHHADSTAASAVRGDLITGQGVSPKWVRLAVGTIGQFLKTDGTDVAWSAHGLTYTDVGAAASGHAHAGVYEPVISAGTTAQFWRGDKSWQTLNQAAIDDLQTGDSVQFASLGLGTVVGSVKKLYVNPTAGTAGSATQANIQGFTRNVAADESNGYTALVVQQDNISVANGFTDSGNRVGILIDCPISGAGAFDGTLGNLIGLWVLGGISSGTATGTLSSSYGIKLDCYDASGTITNKWGIYQTGANFKNYFAGQIQSAVAGGTAPLIIASTTLVSNLNADLWDGYQFADYIDQAVKTTSSPAFTKVTIASNEGHVATNSRASVFRNANQTIASGSDVVVQWDTENNDPGNDFNIASTYAYTTPVAGVYYVALNIVWNNPPAALYWASIRVGGNAACEGITSVGGYVSNNCAMLVNVAAGVAIDAVVHHTQGSDQTILGGQAYCNFSIALVQQNVS